MKIHFGGRPLVLIGFSRGAWWGFEWFSEVEPGLFDRFYAVGGYPLTRYGAERVELQKKAEALKRHRDPSVWIASTADECCQVTQGYAAFYEQLRLDDGQPSSSSVLMSQSLSHVELRRVYLEYTPQEGLLDFIRTGDTSRVQPARLPAPPGAMPP